MPESPCTAKIERTTPATKNVRCMYVSLKIGMLSIIVQRLLKIRTPEKTKTNSKNGPPLVHLENTLLNNMDSALNTFCFFMPASHYC